MPCTRAVHRCMTFSWELNFECILHILAGSKKAALQMMLVLSADYRLGGGCKQIYHRHDCRLLGAGVEW